MPKVGDNIKKELERRKINQRELCRMSGISESAMSKYLSSDKPLRTDILSKISRALDVSMYLVKEIGIPIMHFLPVQITSP